MILRAAVSLAVAALAALVVVLVVRPDLWMVERVVFEGASRASEAQLRHLAEIRNGTAVWAVRPSDVSRGVERHPWVRRAAVRVEWPDTVRVSVQEYSVAGIIQYGGELLYVDRKGQPFLEAPPTDVDYPFVTGITHALDDRHPRLGRLALRDAVSLVEQLDRRGLVARRSVSEVAFSPTLGFTVHTEGARLVFGHGEMLRQLGRLETLVDAGLDLGSPTYVDLAPASVAIVRPLTLPSVPPPAEPSVAAGG
ncbi:MAG: FtsQ-type POTRA domain-containing protein [Myxococcales bacterium]|nr:FtsQ-type POTRA domain-containing protein [Myxococcales bacterium]